MAFDLAVSMDVLGRTPATLQALLEGLAEPMIRGNEGPETFSPFDVVGHLIDGEETDWMSRARIILAQGNDPKFEPYDRFRHKARNRGRTLQSLLEGLAEPMVRGSEGPDTFSPFDVVGHLIDGEETDWMARARIILAQGNDPKFEPYDRFRHKARNRGRTLQSLLEEFARLRAENLGQLHGWKLTEAQLDLTGIHPKFGRVTLRQLLATWVVHDLGHIAQVARVMAKQSRDDVGPWVAFLPVLTDHEKPRS